MPTSWRSSQLFVDALERRQYVTVKDGTVTTHLSEGVCLYMWELWGDALKTRPPQTPEPRIALFSKRPNP